MISIDEWKTKGKIEKLNGFDVFFIDTFEIEKPTILLIHGFPTASWDWQAIWPALEQKYRLVALDMLGFGFSEKPKGHNYSIHEQADIVEALIEYLDLENFHVLAHDYGDTVAQELLARQNDGIGKGDWLSCCLLNGGLFPEQHRPLLIQKLLLSPIGPLVNKLQSRARFGKTFKGIFGKNTPPSDAEIDGFWALMNANDGKTVFPRLIRYLSDRAKHRLRWRAALKDARIPLALINGSVDPISGAHMVEFYREVIGEPAYLAELSEIGHYPQVEAPGEVIEHYYAFLEIAKGFPSGAGSI